MRWWALLWLSACQEVSIEKLEPVLDPDIDSDEPTAEQPLGAADSDTERLDEPPAPPEDADTPGGPADTAAVDTDGAVDTDVAVAVDTALEPIDTGISVAVDTFVPPTDTGAAPGPIVVPPPFAGCPAAPDPVIVAPCTPGVAAYVRQRTFQSVQGAIRAANPGDAVFVCPGVHTGSLQISTDIGLIGADPTGVTVLDGRGRDQIIVHSGGQLVINGLTLRGGTTPQNGGAISSSGASLLVECSMFSDNFADYGGGAIAASGALVIRSSVFRDNEAGYEGGAVSSAGTLTLEDGLFTNNHAGYEGGAMNIPANASILRTTFRGNTADYGGGALQFGTWSNFTLELEDSLFEDNESMYEGGAITFGTWSADTLNARRTRFVGNRAPQGGAITLGSWGAFDVTLEDCELRGNRSQSSAVLDADGWLQQGGRLALVRTSFIDNISQQGPSAFATNSRAATVSVRATDIIVHENVGAASAFFLEAHDNLRCQGCDFGRGPTDNSPSDVSHGGIVQAQAPANFQL